MSLRGDSPAAGKGFLQQFKFGNARHSKLTPVWQTTATALASNLISEEVHYDFLNTVILRLYDTDLALVKEAQQPLLMNRGQDEFVDSRINIWGCWVPYYAN